MTLTRPAGIAGHRSPYHCYTGCGRSDFASTIARCGLLQPGVCGQKRIIFCLLPLSGSRTLGRIFATSPFGRGLTSLRQISSSRCSSLSRPRSGRRPCGPLFLGAPLRALCAAHCRVGAPLPLPLVRLMSCTAGSCSFGSSADLPGLPAIARPSPRLWAHSLAQTRTTASVLAYRQKPSLRRVGLADCAPIAARFSKRFANRCFSCFINWILLFPCTETLNKQHMQLH